MSAHEIDVGFGPHLKSVHWDDEKRCLRLINQKALPHTLETIDCHTVSDVASRILDMSVRGAPAIGVAAAYGMALGALESEADNLDKLQEDLIRHKVELDSTRPTAVNLTWATSKLLKELETRVVNKGLADVAEARQHLIEHAQELAANDVSINYRLAKHGVELVPEGANIMHHCNTGSLATVGYGTALGVIFESHLQKRNIHVWVNETRPRLQGARLTAWELQRAKIPMHLVADSAAAHLLSSGKVDLIVFGADRVAANGDVANKVGSMALAIIAREYGIPVYACVPTSTIDLSLRSGEEIEIEERHGDEVRHVHGVPVAPKDVPVFNPAFDVTPHRFITGIITEEGVCRPPYNLTLAKAKHKGELRHAKLDAMERSSE